MERNLEVKRMVVKIGSSSLTYPNTHKISIDRIDRLAREISDLTNSGIEVILVSSGAIATGMSRLNIENKPSELEFKQALACVGQSNLIEIYNKCFADYGYTVGQLLLTKYVFDNTSMRKNAENCINQMLKMNIIPIINENDSISIDEIKLGDNDNLSYIVAKIVNADLLVLLSDIDGVFDKDPHKYSDAKILEEANIDNLKNIDTNGGSTMGTGGILTKIKACIDASDAGINAIIANANEKFILKQIIRNKIKGTLFKAKTQKNRN